VVCSVAFIDAYAAQVARRFTGTPYVFVPNGLPLKVKYVRSLTLGGSVYKRAVCNSDGFVLFSDYMRRYFLERWQFDGIVIPLGVDENEFQPKPESKVGPPKIVCAAALQDRRKGGRLLMKAFNLLKEKQPDAILQIASPRVHELPDQLLPLVSPQWRSDVEFIAFKNEDPSSRWNNLPQLFAAATVSVLPSLWEPFGMVVIESMAAGTPVVAARDGALPEVIRNPGVGRLFEPGDDSTGEPTNVEGLAQALDEGITLAQDPGISERCREYAMQYTWQKIGARYEQELKRAAGLSNPVRDVVGAP
jgi:phosphatidyl-myo-inositol alpha-mannosyltransferase